MATLAPDHGAVIVLIAMQAPCDYLNQFAPSIWAEVIVLIAMQAPCGRHAIAKHEVQKKHFLNNSQTPLSFQTIRNYFASTFPSAVIATIT